MSSPPRAVVREFNQHLNASGRLLEQALEQHARRRTRPIRHRRCDPRAYLPDECFEPAREPTGPLTRAYARQHSILDVPVFACGTWNDATYTRSDLDEMVRNHGRAGFRPPIMLNVHEFSVASHFAFGYVANLRRKDALLVADLVDIMPDVLRGIAAGRYPAVSAEILGDLVNESGERLGLVLSAIALLPKGQTPAVTVLPPLIVKPRRRKP